MKPQALPLAQTGRVVAQRTRMLASIAFIIIVLIADEPLQIHAFQITTNIEPQSV